MRSIYQLFFFSFFLIFLSPPVSVLIPLRRGGHPRGAHARAGGAHAEELSRQCLHRGAHAEEPAQGSHLPTWGSRAWSRAGAQRRGPPRHPALFLMEHRNSVPRLELQHTATSLCQPAGALLHTGTLCSLHSPHAQRQPSHLASPPSPRFGGVSWDYSQMGYSCPFSVVNQTVQE